MAVNKNFVVKNGLEVGTDIIVASVDNKNVGVGTTVGQVLLDVRGAIGATHLSVSGVGTVVTLNSTNFTGTAGTITTLTSTDATITNGTITNGTITNLTGTAATITNGTITNLTGTAATITTIEATNGSITNFTPTNINASGVITATSFYGDGSNLSNVGGYWVQNDAGIHTTGSVGVGTTNPNSVVPSDNTAILNVGILTAYKLYGDGSGLTGLAGNPDLQTVLDTSNTSTTGMSITGVSTFTTAEVTNGNITNLTGTAGTITNGTITNLTGTAGTITNLLPININSSGVTTLTTLDVQTKFDVYDSEAVFHNDLYVAGNLSIGGTTVTFGVENLVISDKDLIVGYTTNVFNDDVSTDNTANHGGIAVASTEGSPLVPFKVTGINTLPDTYKQLMWVKGDTFGVGTTDAWMSNYAVGVGSTLVPTGVVFAAGGIQFTDSEITTPTVTIGSGIITATSGIVTYYGDGSGLTGAGSTVADDTTTNETFYPLFTQSTSGTVTATKVSTTKFTFNPSTGEASATNFNSTSDENLKTNIHTVENSLDIVDQLRGVSFDWKENGKSSYGVIAQELEQVLPELVAQTDPKSVNYNGIIGVLIEAVKELKKEISDLKNNK